MAPLFNHALAGEPILESGRGDSTFDKIRGSGYNEPNQIMSTEINITGREVILGSNRSAVLQLYDFESEAAFVCSLARPRCAFFGHMERGCVPVSASAATPHPGEMIDSPAADLPRSLDFPTIHAKTIALLNIFEHQRFSIYPLLPYLRRYVHISSNHPALPARGTVPESSQGKAADPNQLDLVARLHLYKMEGVPRAFFQLVILKEEEKPVAATASSVHLAERMQHFCHSHCRQPSVAFINTTITKEACPLPAP
ncbi:hypothetical protein NDU88_006902 [Pleurodeles waltl]|uniref:Uncharacterized protein n=1 Tax=Pleurodeles waltl TaxID=8319 RepID=A0AAV7WEQ2_PLEWA|nr:hypothetical protein NDU88_006902 [Pleurodeles waltl]